MKKGFFYFKSLNKQIYLILDNIHFANLFIVLLSTALNIKIAVIALNNFTKDKYL
jgi:hypothetical protein